MNKPQFYRPKAQKQVFFYLKERIPYKNKRNIDNNMQDYTLYPVLSVPHLFNKLRHILLSVSIFVMICIQNSLGF
jgi:hypothetical protein